MRRAPFWLRRAWMLAQGARADRQRPDVDRLAAIDDPERFVWAILPYAARTFAASIVMLPMAQATAAAVGYLYCRMLDTYEDLGDATESLGAFAARFPAMTPPPPLAATPANPVDELLVRRCDLVDAVYAGLPAADRQRIGDLVRAMAGGMAWSARHLAEHGGVLAGPAALRRYCRHVMGEPVAFTLSLVLDADLTDQQHADAVATGELIQLANITRDVERDLARGVGYHPSLRPHVGREPAAAPVREARRALLAHALPNVGAYTRLAGQLTPRGPSLARASAVLMLLHTDRHYRGCVRSVGERGWGGPDRSGTMLASAACSARWSRRVLARVEGDFLAAAARL